MNQITNFKTQKTEIKTSHQRELRQHRTNIWFSGCLHLFKFCYMAYCITFSIKKTKKRMLNLQTYKAWQVFHVFYKILKFFEKKTHNILNSLYMYSVHNKNVLKKISSLPQTYFVKSDLRTRLFHVMPLVPLLDLWHNKWNNDTTFELTYQYPVLY